MATTNQRTYVMADCRNLHRNYYWRHQLAIFAPWGVLFGGMDSAGYATVHHWIVATQGIYIASRFYSWMPGRGVARRQYASTIGAL